MAYRYVSQFIIPGRRAGNMKQIINCSNCSKIEVNESTQATTEPFIITSGNPTIDNNNGYYTITFLNNGGITFLEPITSNDNDFYALVVGGGGGGGNGYYPPTVPDPFGIIDETQVDTPASGGGGGAGGQVIFNPMSVEQYYNYNVIVGQGGQGSYTSPATKGSPSIFSTLTAVGGNPGEDASSESSNGQGGLGTNGNDGGTGGVVTQGKLGPIYNNPTNGFNGVPININSTTNYYGGGGGGGAYVYQTQSSSGGLGGGGNGLDPNSGGLNTGGGGGGNGQQNNYDAGGQGGSGLVILSFKYFATNTSSSFICKTCICPSPINSKIIKNSNPDVIPISTQKERQVNAIKYASGGRVVFGNPPYNSNGMSILGEVYGGYQPPIKNKF